MLLRSVKPHFARGRPVARATAVPAPRVGAFRGLIDHLAISQNCTIAPQMSLLRRDESQTAVTMRGVVPGHEVLYPGYPSGERTLKKHSDRPKKKKPLKNLSG